ncbi:MAG: hypothetical protein IKY23_03350 [Lachnospiraceae bacterium]|nr:hypothetical protein [Lachnospiraceae bacterium]
MEKKKLAQSTTEYHKPGKERSKKSVKGLLALFALSVLGMLLCVALLVAYVDPFFHYHKPLPGFPYQVDNQLSQNPGMARHMEYDSVLLGSSMTVNFNTRWFAELMDLNTLKLSYSAAYPKDQANIMEKVFGSGHEVKQVFLGIDVITYTGGVEETKYPIPEYLYDDKPINDIYYLLNKDVLLNYILRPIADPEPTDLATMYASWWTEEYYSEDWVLLNYVQPEIISEETNPEDFTGRAKRNLETNICPFIEANPDTEFVIFFPPYSILFWNNVLRENHMKATIEEYRYIANHLNSYDNVELYFFPDREDIVLDLNNYADYSHYHPRFNRFMAECFVDGTGIVAKESGIPADASQEKEKRYEKAQTIDAYLAHMEEVVEAFDFDGLLN